MSDCSLTPTPPPSPVRVWFPWRETGGRAKPSRGKPTPCPGRVACRTGKPGHIWDGYLQPKCHLNILTKHASQRHNNSVRNQRQLYHTSGILHYSNHVCLQRNYFNSWGCFFFFFFPQSCSSGFINMSLNIDWRWAPMKKWPVGACCVRALVS